MRIKNILAVAITSLILTAPAVLAQFQKSVLFTNTANCFPDNTTGAITPAILRTCINAIISSFQQYSGVNPQAGATYTIQPSDYGQLVTFNSGVPVAVTLSPANSSGYTTFNFYVSNLSTGNVVIAPTGGSLINGLTFLNVVQNQTVKIISDATNYQIWGQSNNTGILPVTLGGTGLTIVNATNLLIGNGTGALTQLTPINVPGIALVSNGAGSNPGYGVTQVPGGGTGGITFTLNGVMLGNGSSALSVSNAGTTGQALIGNTGAQPTFQSLRQIIPIANGPTALTQSTTAFVLSNLSATEAIVQAICPIQGTFKNLRVQSTAPAAGQTLTNTLRVNGGDTSITCTIQGAAATTCVNTVNTAVCQAGQPYSLKVVTSATTGTLSAVTGGVEFDNP